MITTRWEKSLGSLMTMKEKPDVPSLEDTGTSQQLDRINQITTAANAVPDDVLAGSDQELYDTTGLDEGNDVASGEQPPPEPPADDIEVVSNLNGDEIDIGTDGEEVVGTPESAAPAKPVTFWSKNWPWVVGGAVVAVATGVTIAVVVSRRRGR